MHYSVNIVSVLIVLIQLIVRSSSAANSSVPAYYHGLLSDVLEIYNNENNLSITPLCGQQLESIQMGINVKDIWAMKCEYNLHRAAADVCLILCTERVESADLRWQRCQKLKAHSIFHIRLDVILYITWLFSFENSYYPMMFGFKLHGLCVDLASCMQFVHSVYNTCIISMCTG